MYIVTANRTRSDKKRVIVRECVVRPTEYQLAQLKKHLVSHSLEFDIDTQLHVVKQKQSSSNSGK